MRAGQLDRQILIERKSVTQDPTFGTELVTWVPLASERFWAEVQDSRPSRAESVTQGLAVARNQVVVRMRYRADIDSSMRITVYGDGANQVLQIVGGPAPIEGRKQFLEMVCERISS